MDDAVFSVNPTLEFMHAKLGLIWYQLLARIWLLPDIVSDYLKLVHVIWPEFNT